MTDQHPITPPRELVKEWIAEIWHEGTPVQVAQSDLHLANHAAQWGYDQRGEVNEAKLQQARDEELEACISWMKKMGYWGEDGQAISLLRAARRPKPPSLKEQALAVLDPSNTYGSITQEEEYRISVAKAEIILRALEALPGD
jgi:hypothetical protein